MIYINIDIRNHRKSFFFLFSWIFSNLVYILCNTNDVNGIGTETESGTETWTGSENETGTGTGIGTGTLE